MSRRGKGKRLRSLALAAPMAGALLAGLAVPASATAARPTAGSATPAGIAPADTAPADTAPAGTGPRYGTHGWAGHAWHTSSRQVTASLRLPSVASATNAGAAFWAGFGTGPGIEQAGFTANMVGGHLRWTAWYELYPSPPAGFGKAAYTGDYVSMTVTYRGGGWFTLTVCDVTRHWTATVTRHATVASMGTAEAIVEAYGPPLARFSPATFDHVSASARTWTYSMPGARPSALRQGSFTVRP
jgi:hypothetical protein